MVEDSRTNQPSFGQVTSFSGSAVSRSDMVLRLVESKIEASEARTRNMLTEAKGELIDMVNAKSSRADVWGVGVAIITVILGVLAIAGDRFDGGIQLQSSVSEVTRQVQDISDQNAQTIRELVEQTEEADDKLDLILENLEVPTDD